MANQLKEHIDHLFIRMTRESIGFEHEPNDQIHWVNLTEDTKHLYNLLIKKRMAYAGDHLMIADTISRLNNLLRMIEGGTIKIDEERFSLDNTEKVDYIKDKWGDSPDNVIMYFYVAEEQKLRDAFKSTQILQCTSNAEGIDLSEYKNLIIYSQDYSVARHIQRRARQANINRLNLLTYISCCVRNLLVNRYIKWSVSRKKNLLTNSMRLKKYESFRISITS